GVRSGAPAARAGGPGAPRSSSVWRAGGHGGPDFLASGGAAGGLGASAALASGGGGPLGAAGLASGAFASGAFASGGLSPAPGPGRTVGLAFCATSSAYRTRYSAAIFGWPSLSLVSASTRNRSGSLG